MVISLPVEEKYQVGGLHSTHRILCPFVKHSKAKAIKAQVDSKRKDSSFGLRHFEFCSPPATLIKTV